MEAFQSVANKISALKGSEIIGYVGNDNEYPFFEIKRGKGLSVLLSAGIHGLEPAGVYAIISFFEKHSKKYEDKFSFHAFPCVNPYGFDKNTRYDGNDRNLNREFKHDTKAKEINLILPRLKQYLFAMDLHETLPEFEPRREDEPQGGLPTDFYLWEVCEDKKKRLGHKIIKAIKKQGFTVCKWDKIFDDKNNGGVISYPENCGTKCYKSTNIFENYLEVNHTKQTFTIETPTGWKLEDRIKAQLVSLMTVLDEKILNED